MMKSEEKIEVVIDRSKWRTGDDSLTLLQTGDGETCLLNSEQFKCCLGFICEAAGVYERDLYCCSPSQLLKVVPGLSQIDEDDIIMDSDLGLTAMQINDSNLHPQIKEEKLLELFADSPYNLRFVGDYNFIYNGFYLILGDSPTVVEIINGEIVSRHYTLLKNCNIKYELPRYISKEIVKLSNIDCESWHVFKLENDDS